MYWLILASQYSRLDTQRTKMDAQIVDVHLSGITPFFHNHMYIISNSHHDPTNYF